LNYKTLYALLKYITPTYFETFPAWSSVREPTQVFVLLENLFQAFDKIAKKRQVFKVRIQNTVGWALYDIGRAGGAELRTSDSHFFYCHHPSLQRLTG